MSTEMGLEQVISDYRLADFKLLLPLGKDLRLLVTATRERAFLPHLANELGQIDLTSEEDPAGWDEMLAAMPERSQLRRLETPDGLYDLVCSDSLSAGRHLRPGGVLCCFRRSRNGQAPLDLAAIGSWRPYPDWPAFRVLIPDHAAGWRAAVRHLRIFPARSFRGLCAHFWPGMAAHLLPERGIALYRRAGPDPRTSVLSELDDALAGGTKCSTAKPSADCWLLASGRLGPGNPILAFRIDAKGQPQRLIKAARFAEGRHLAAEADQLREIEHALGQAGTRVIRPTASAVISGRCALAYRYEPTLPFFGIRWRLQARAGLCIGMTVWLADIGRITRREAKREIIEGVHIAPLKRLIERRIFEPDMQHAAAAACGELERLGPRLPMVLEHGDLGIYNLRLTRGDGSDFKVLDWGSSTFEGIPLGDLAYLLSSSRAPRRLAERCIRDYLARMDLDCSAAPALWFSFLARRWEELDGVRPPVPGDSTSGGGILLPTHRLIAGYLEGL